MGVLDRHVLWEWLKIFAVVLAATLGLLVLADMTDNLRDFLDFGAGPVEVIYYYVVLIPSHLPVVLPISVLISLLYALGQLHRNHEFVAMRAAGLGLLRITRSLWLAGLVLTGLGWWLNASIVPTSVEQARRVRANVEFSAEARQVGLDRVGIVPALAFDNQRDQRMWFINRFSRYTHRAFGVTVAELDRQRRETTRIVAREAYFDEVRGVWVFLWGRETWFDPQTGETLRAVAFTEKSFPHIGDDPALMLRLGRKPSELSLRELRQIVEYYTADENPQVVRYAVHYQRLLASPLGTLIVIGLAIPFAVSGVRTNPAVGVSKSIGLFFLYYLLTSFAGLLGERQVLEPAMAAWAPNLAMIALALWLFARVR